MLFLLLSCSWLLMDGVIGSAHAEDTEEASETPVTQEFVVAGSGDVRTITTTPGTLKFSADGCDVAHGAFAVWNDTEFEITVNAVVFGSDGSDLGFGIEPRESDIVGMGNENGLWMVRAYRVAPGERSVRGVVYDPSLAVSRWSRGGVILNFSFGEPELDDPNRDGVNDNVGGIVALVGQAPGCEPDSEPEGPAAAP